MQNPKQMVVVKRPEEEKDCVKEVTAAGGVRRRMMPRYKLEAIIRLRAMGVLAG